MGFLKRQTFQSLMGILIGDCCGSPYEGKKVTSHPRIGAYTDDTEQAYGIALWLKSKDHSQKNLIQCLKKVYTGHDRGYGSNQAAFLEGKPCRTNSYGNGSAMRAAPIGEFAKDLKMTIELSKLQSEVTHSHPQAIRGAVSIAVLAYLVHNDEDINKIKDIYPEALLPIQGKKYLCSLEAVESVPPAIEAFITGKSFEEVLEKALKYGGDTDTIAAMACGLAALKYGVPENLLKKVTQAHPDNSNMVKKINSL